MTDNRENRGKLYVVGTPIGNVDDLSPRARDVLAKADVVAAEDTRHTRGLLSRIGVNRDLLRITSITRRSVFRRCSSSSRTANPWRSSAMPGRR